MTCIRKASKIEKTNNPKKRIPSDTEAEYREPTIICSVPNGLVNLMNYLQALVLNLFIHSKPATANLLSE